MLMVLEAKSGRVSRCQHKIKRHRFGRNGGVFFVGMVEGLSLKGAMFFGVMESCARKWLEIGRYGCVSARGIAAGRQARENSCSW